MPDSPAQTVRGFLQAFQDADLEGCLAVMDPDIVIEHSPGLPYGGRFQGAEGFGGFVEKMLARMEAAPLSFEVHDAGPFAVSRIEARFTSRESGRSFDMPLVELYWVSNGKITRIEPYYQDTLAVAELYTNG